MRTLVALPVLLMVAVPATAQTVTSDWAAVPKANRVVYVTTDTGAEASGRLLRIDADSLTIRDRDQERTFQREHVIFVDRRGDSLRNGAIVGAITGAGLGALSGVMSDCGGLLEAPRDCTAGERARVLAIMTGFSTGVGIGIDALVRGRTRMYGRAAAGRSTTAIVAPFLHHRAVGLALSTSW